MNKLIELIKKHQQKIALTIGYLVVASLAFGLGHYSVKVPKIDPMQSAPTTQLPVNYNPNISGTQTTSTTLNCQGKIKGSSSLIYHMPGGAFYDKTTRPIRCFDSETEAKAAGFRKSSR
jgi:hypothetical protein